MAEELDVRRKRQLILMAAGGIALIVLALASSFLPVRASFEGESSYTCGTPFRRWRSATAVKSQWTRDSLVILSAYPVARLTQETPLRVCQEKVHSRVTIMKAMVVVALLLIGAAIAIYWHLFGFVYDPHV